MSLVILLYGMEPKPGSNQYVEIVAMNITVSKAVPLCHRIYIVYIVHSLTKAAKIKRCFINNRNFSCRALQHLTVASWEMSTILCKARGFKCHHNFFFSI